MFVIRKHLANYFLKFGWTEYECDHFIATVNISNIFIYV